MRGLRCVLGDGKEICMQEQVNKFEEKIGGVTFIVSAQQVEGAKDRGEEVIKKMINE